MIEKILDIVFPKTCLKCKKQGEGYICSSCFFDLKCNSKLEKIEGMQYEYLVYFDRYIENTRENILLMKFREKAYFTEFYAELLIKNEKINLFLMLLKVIVLTFLINILNFAI